MTERRETKNEYPRSHRSRHKTKVSVVIPCYNHALYLPEAVRSVLDQTYRDIEIIIVNDGSTDNSQETANQLIKENPCANIILLNQLNSGLPTSRNNGIRAASEDYIFVLDADDKIHPQTIEKMAKILDEHEKVGLVYSDIRFFGDKNKEYSNPDFDPQRHLKEDIVTGNCMFRKKVWEVVGGYNPNMKYGYEDWDFSIGAYEKGWDLYHVKEPLFFYRRAGVTMVHTSRAYDQYLRAKMVLNHQSLYSEQEVAKAREVLAEYQRAEVLGSKEHGLLVSIIISSYTDTNRLKETLESLQDQIYRDFEVIIINNDLPDLGDMIDKLELKDKIVYITRGMRRNPGSSKNAAIKVAKGKYIAYLDEDTIFSPQHISTLVEQLEISDCKLAYNDAFKIIRGYVNEELIEINKAIAFDKDLDTKTIAAYNPVPLVCFMHEKELLDEVGFFDESLYAFEEWEFLIRASGKSSMNHIRKIALEFTPNGAQHIVSPKTAMEYLIAANTVYKKSRKHIPRETQTAKDFTGRISLLYRETLLRACSHSQMKELIKEVMGHKKLVVKFLAGCLFGGYFLPKTIGIASFTKKFFLSRAMILLKKCSRRKKFGETEGYT